MTPRLVSALALAAGLAFPVSAYAAGPSFSVDSGDRISGFVLEGSTDGSTAQPIGTPGKPINITGSVSTGGSPPITPGAGLASAITTGGTAVTVFAANTTTSNSRICNPASNTALLWVNEVATATTTTGGSNEAISPGQCWYAAGVLTTAVSANALAALAFTAVQ